MFAQHRPQRAVALAHDKIVDLQPNRGAFVHVPDLKEMQDVFEMSRIEMETMILNILADLPVGNAPQAALCDDKARRRGFRQGRPRRLEPPVQCASTSNWARLVGNDVLFDIMNTLCGLPDCRRGGHYCIARKNTPSIRIRIPNTAKSSTCCWRAGATAWSKILRRHLGNCMERLERLWKIECRADKRCFLQAVFNSEPDAVLKIWMGICNFQTAISTAYIMRQ